MRRVRISDAPCVLHRNPPVIEPWVGACTVDGNVTQTVNEIPFVHCNILLDIGNFLDIKFTNATNGVSQRATCDLYGGPPCILHSYVRPHTSEQTGGHTIEAWPENMTRTGWDPWTALCVAATAMMRRNTYATAFSMIVCKQL